MRFFSATTAGGLIAILVAGCAAIEKQETGSTERLLSAAFNIKPADTPEKLANLQMMKQHKVVRRELSNGQLRFLYADAAVCRCLYVDEQTCQQYQKLAVQQENTLLDQQAALDNSLDNWWAYDPDAY